MQLGEMAGLLFCRALDAARLGERPSSLIRPGRRGICISRDFGASWQYEAQGIPLQPVTSVVLDPRSPKGRRPLYAGVFMQGVYKSTDDGKTWTLKRNGLGHPKNRRVSRVVLHRDGTLFALVCVKRPEGGEPLMPEGGGLYRSTDGAESWEKITASGLFLYPKDFSVHPDSSPTILLGTCDTNWKDRAGGLYRTVRRPANLRHHLRRQRLAQTRRAARQRRRRRSGWQSHPVRR